MCATGRLLYSGMADEEKKRPDDEPEEVTPEEIPTYDPEVIPTAGEPFGEPPPMGAPFGKFRTYGVNLRCCGCSGTSLLLFILAVLLIVYFWR